jgi:glutamyl-tRNA synthetase
MPTPLLPAIADLHRQAVATGQPLYCDPATGLWVQTEATLRARGACCGNGCRHCPWQGDKAEHPHGRALRQHRGEEALVGRMAPSPTGLLHAGNARSLLLAWLGARAYGGRILLRVEDLLPGMEAQIAPMLDDLSWLGLDWDGPQPGDLWHADQLTELADLTSGFAIQSRRHGLYSEVLEALERAGLVYPCVCTRKDIETATRAPHMEERGAAYPGNCRGRFSSLAEAVAWEQERAAREGRQPLGVALRLRMPTAPMEFEDLLCGPRLVELQTDVGDIVVQRKDGGFAYMIAVVIDDLAMGVSEVVRGDDLLDATAQQLAVYQALRLIAPQEMAKGDAMQAFWSRALAWRPPLHRHVPLVLGLDGRRLAKRNQALHLRQLRGSGTQAREVRRWLAASIGLDGLDDLSAMAKEFRWNLLPRAPVTLGAIGS